MRATVTVTDIFSTRGRVDVLRLLWGVRIPLTAAEAARRVHLSHPAASEVLWALESLRIVESAPVGRGSVYWLNRENVYVRTMIDPVFSAEAQVPDALLEWLRSRYEAGSQSVVLFGSYARGDQTPDSDVDVIVVAENETTKQSIEERIISDSEAFRREFGATLSTIVYSPQEASQLRKRGPGLYDSLLSDGVRVAGTSVHEWRGHGQGQ